ncbi:F-actin-capping protein subunit beta [Orbilia oligospora]|uniref:F-actin-capping protein subunit beta n=1 Tax=Orbilia oligospora TaxID=2813651 RepID=A0A7C8JSG2_ORBOL|nr:F-actin-capping protein subunit beta [Orbilia oligospora]
MVPYRISKPYSLRSFLLICLIIGIFLHIRSYLFQVLSSEAAYISNTVKASHPIEKLILQNYRKHQNFLNRQSKTPEEAIKVYKKRYQRDPPPGFSKWVRYALAHNSTVIDDYDMIEERIAPFRSISSFDLTRRMKAWQESADAFETVKIRDGKFVDCGEQFKNSIEDIVDQLPDMDILLNWLDEPRIVGYDHLRDSNKVIMEDYASKDAWEILSGKCHFSSQKKAKRDTTTKVKYVENPKEALDICAHPEAWNQHGFFNSPSNFRATRNVIPFFSTTSMSTMADLLTPGLDYVDWHYIGDAKTVDNTNYTAKKSQMYWKGWSTGSWFKETSWKRNHRIRFVEKFRDSSMFNIGFSKYVQCDGYCEKLEELVGLVPIDPPTTGFEYKFAMDLDGNGYSGRLVPWVHYVPVSLGMEELESALDYFAHDAKGLGYGEQIAMGGKEWAKKSLRPIDMTIYTYRLLLEYAALFEGGAERRMD